MSKRLLRLLSFVLTVAMLINMLPMNVLAAELDEENPSTSIVENESESGENAVSVIGEVESLREEGIKHFRLSDGSFVAVSYGLPVHYQDNDGQWTDIDNSLVKEESTRTFRTANADKSVAFAASLEDGSLFTTSNGRVSVSMTLLDTVQAENMISGEFEEDPDVEETTVEETVPEETVEDTIPTEEENTPETTEATESPVETEPVVILEERPAEISEEEDISSDESVETASDDIAEEDSIIADALSIDEEISESTEAVEDLSEDSETDETISEEIEPTATDPIETEPIVTEPEETVAESVPEETIPLETTEETVSEETTAETEPDEENFEGVTYNRHATAEIAPVTSNMLSMQDGYSWSVEDIIPKNLQSALLYEDVFPGVDLQYTTFGYNIKEQIIVNAPQEAYRYDFLLETNGLTPVLNEDGSVDFLDAEGKEVYEIPMPYMEDEAGALSPDVVFTLNETEQGYVLTVEADKNWINAEDREFPVKIDPTVAVVSGHALEDIYSAYTMEAAPNDTTLGRQYLYVGAQPYSTTNDGRYRIYMHFNNMPSIPQGSEVVNSVLSLYKFQYTQRYCEEFPIGVYEVTTEKPSTYADYFKWFAAMTWRRAQPEYDTSNAIDFAWGRAGKEYLEWNMTELVKKWYAEGTDNTTAALVMMNEDEIDTYYYYASATFYAYAGSIPPILTVSYRNNTGIEPYYTYATLGAAEAGTAYIADATGQLKVGKELVSYASSTNPFSLNLIYNSDYFSQSSSTAYQPPNKLGLSMNVGEGWTLDHIQKIIPETISFFDYLKYTDGDGTIHYFMEDPEKDDGYYYDEDGLGLKIKDAGSGTYYMSDDKGNEWIFTGNYLTTIQDADGNKIKINYSSGRISSITQVNNGETAIEVAKFTYTSGNLSSVTDAAGNTYTLTYSGTKLASIKKNGTTIAEYSYEGNRLISMEDWESSYSLNFQWTNGCVSKYYENDGVNDGAQVRLYYPSHSQTTYLDYGADRTRETDDDILTHYLFDYAGRTANAYTTDAAGNVLGATNAAYTAAASIEKDANRTARTSSIGIAAQQLMRNTGLEGSSSIWTLSGASISTSNPRSGAKSIKGTLSGSGTQYARASSEKLDAGKTYTFSAFVNTEDVTRFDGKGIYLKVSNGSNAWESHPVNYTTASTVDDGWVRISVTFTPVTTGAHTIAIYNEGAVGTFYADDFQLERGEAPSSYNLIENGGMEMDVDYWTMGSNARLSTSRGAASSAASLKITANPADRGTNAYQDVILNLPGTQTYVLSGWVQANAVPDNDDDLYDPDDTSKQCGLRATITYSDGTTEGHYVPFNPDLTGTWQFTSTAVVPEKPSKTVSKIRVTCAFEGNANYAYFDNISLLREVAQTMKYDDDGNLESVTAPGLKEDINTYQGGNLIKTVTGGNGTYEYTYDSTYDHRLKSVTNGLITQAMNYDGVGNVTSTKLSGSGSKTISTSAEYGGSGNRLVSTTDATGAEIAYGYSNVNAQMMALPTSITDPNGTVTTSAYDSHYRVTQTGIADVADLVYTYSDGNLGTVKRTDSTGKTQTYSFTYDGFGNMQSLKVGDKTLATYSYNPDNGLLAKQTYGNGDSVSFTYDTLGRTKTVTFADGRVMTYTYNGEGRLHSVVETGGKATVTYLYTYDSIGRLISSEQKEGSNSVLRTHQTYDENNQLTKQSWQIGENAYTERYTYNEKDGSLNTMTTGTGDTLTMNYDGLRRLSSMSGGPFSREYTYRDISSTATAMQVSGLRYPSLNGGTNFGYTYDKLGNIATYTAPGKSAVTYTYDEQGQLLKAAGDKAYTYSYDSVGNILTASDGSATHRYTYGDSGWGDLLTAFDGESITYDQIGNPISYYNGTRWAFTWENGRRLTKASSTAGTINYTYDLSGLRTSKTVGSVTHHYLYAGGKLLQDSDGTNTLDFFYNAHGTPYALKHTVGTESPSSKIYYYITNLQGDVMQLVDTNGNAVATYDYDPYGKVISASGAMAEINPLRYRGYVYDTESGFYYLQSRYYDPAIGRFVNADTYVSTGHGIFGYNSFAYCNNNPVIYVDNGGDFGILASMLIGGAVGGVTQFVGGIIDNAMQGKTGLELFKNTGTWGQYISSIASGAACAIPGANTVVSVVCDIAAPALQQAVDCVVYKKDWSWKNYTSDVADNIVSSRVGGKVSDLVGGNSPQFIRDIKDDARKLGIKGTKKLNNYLSKAQNESFLGKQFLDFAFATSKKVYSSIASKLASLF